MQRYKSGTKGAMHYSHKLMLSSYDANSSADGIGGYLRRTGTCTRTIWIWTTWRMTMWTIDKLRDNPDTPLHLFWKKTPLSQWTKTPFTVDGITYPTAEHWMMHQKAALFGDTVTADLILKTDSPKEAKAFGRRVRLFDQQAWDERCMDIVVQGNIHKFRGDIHANDRCAVGRQSMRKIPLTAG